MGHVADGHYEMVGTFNGNPMAMAATRAMLTEVATAEAYERMDRLAARMVTGVEQSIADHGLAAHVVSVGACIGLTVVCMILMLGQTRVGFAMARDGLLPRALARVHPKYGTPYRITLITAAAVAPAISSRR